MKVNLLATVAAIALGFGIPVTAQAQETIAAVETVAPVEVDPIASPELLASFVSICESDAKLSEKAQLACVNNTLPKVSKATTTFRNTGIGAEFNTLIRQGDIFAAKTE